MKRFLFPGVIVANLVLVLAVVNGSILRKQAIVDTGQRVILELVPVDPRSLMQGDYMQLGYALSRDEAFRNAAEAQGTRGFVVLSLDEKGIGQFARIAEGNDFLDNEAPLGYRKWRRGFLYGIETFFFEEGSAERFERAKYAELRVSSGGEPVIVNLLDEELEVIEPGRDSS
ncbi:MAG: GDYXXLXY domain-containing protein [Verrucomicrobiota bacterium]